MSTDKKHKIPNAPNLRFPEFTGEWKESTIGKEFELYSGNTPSRLDKENFVGDVNWITSGELKEHYIGDTKEKISERSAKESNLKIMPEGTFVIAIYGLEAEGVRSTGSITTQKTTISQACMAFTPKGDISNEFLYSWYKKHGNVIGLRYAQGTKQQNLSYDILEKFKIRYPSRQEQDKLNSFISLLDTRIATQIGAIEKLESLIKASAANLTQCDRQVRLSDCLECHTSTLQEKDVAKKGIYPVYGASGICGYTDQPMCTEPAILIVKDGSGVGSITFAEEPFSVLGTLNYLTAKNSANIRYLYCCLLNFDFMPYKTGMAIPHIYFKDYGKGKISWLDEPKRGDVPNLIFSIKSKLNIEKQLLGCYKAQKQYLLSQMFI